MEVKLLLDTNAIIALLKENEEIKKATLRRAPRMQSFDILRWTSGYLQKVCTKKIPFGKKNIFPLQHNSLISP